MLHRHKKQADDSDLPLDQWEKMIGNIVDLQLLPKLTGPGREHWPSPKLYVVQLHPEGREAFRGEVHIHPIDHPDDFFFSQPGTVTAFIVNPVSGEVRFDMSDQRNSVAAHQSAVDLMQEEFLADKPADAGQAITGPPWVVPAECPQCGARVDQATQSMELAPKCGFCHQPLPADPRARF